MRNTRQVVWGIVLILVSSVLLFGVLSLSQAEGIIHLSTTTPPPASTFTPQQSPSMGASPTPVILSCPTSAPLTCPSSVPPNLPPTLPPTPPPTRTPPTAPTATLTKTIVLTPTPTPSPTQTLQRLPTLTLKPAPTLTLKPAPTRTPLSCGAPHGWVIYVVQKGDTLYHLGQVYGIPYTVIQRANCLVNFNIRIGQFLFVPPWPPIMPSPTLFFDTFVPTEISTFYLPFETPATETPTEPIPTP